MRIVYIIPGFGGTFYCENCFRDASLMRLARQSGHEAVIAPLYLPVKEDAALPNRDIPLFYGAVQAYLKQLVPMLRRMPRWLERFFNAKPFLKLAMAMSGSTDAQALEGMTLSVLRGENGYQARDLAELARWLADEVKPDVVHISNALLIGLAAGVRRRLPDVTIVCSLQDEDTWIDVMSPNGRREGWRLVREGAAFVDRFVAVSRYYAAFMRKKLRLPAAAVTVVPVGIDTSTTVPPGPRSADAPRTVGYLSRLCEELGLDLLIDAFIRLKRTAALSDVRLLLTGGVTAVDKPFLRGQRRKLKRAGLVDDVEFAPDLFRSDPADFWRRCTVLSVPAVQGEAFGTYILESLLAGVPVVQPELGGFPEIIRKTRGGLLYSPNSAATLTRALKNALTKTDLDAMGRRGQRAVRKHYDMAAVMERLMKVYGRGRRYTRR